jgi:hypothetical protein
MKRTAMFLLWGVLLGNEFAWAQESPPQTPQPSGTKSIAPPAFVYPLEAWKQFIVREANFSVLLPTAPKDETARYRLQAGMAEDHRFTVPTRDGNYQVACTFLSDNIATPESIRVRFATLLKNLQSSPNLQWISGGETEYAGNPGIEFKVQFVDSKLIMWSRQYFAFGCVYEVTARYLSPELKEPALFMESFKLLGPPQRRPLNLVSAQDLALDFTPLAQNTYYVSVKKLREHANEKPEPKFDLKGRLFSGSVTLLVTVSPEGKVLQAEPLDGASHFYNEAVKTTKKWTFKPFLLEGKPVKVQGRLIFTFGITELEKTK